MELASEVEAMRTKYAADPDSRQCDMHREVP
jgi:hypothetical protein